MNSTTGLVIGLVGSVFALIVYNVPENSFDDLFSKKTAGGYKMSKNKRTKRTQVKQIKQIKQIKYSKRKY